MMKNALAVSMYVLTSLVSTTTIAQDLMADAGSVTRSYNYVEGFYLLNLENDLPDNAEVDFPVLLRASVDLNEQYSIKGEFLNQSYTVVDNGVTGAIDVGSYELSLRYRDTFHAMADTDWVAGVGYGIIDLKISVDTFELADETTGFYSTYLGLRRTISQRLEGEVGVNFTRLTDGGSFSGTGDAALVYRVSPKLDVALGGTNLTDGNNYGIGIRYTWN